jgi:hypothetical protein
MRGTCGGTQRLSRPAAVPRGTGGTESTARRLARHAEWEAMRCMAVRTALRREGLPPDAEPTESARRAGEEEIAGCVADWGTGCAALAEWVRRRQVGEPVEDEPPPWPGQVEGAE